MLNEKKHRPNLSEIAYEEIRVMILTGELAQGERLLLDEMSNQLNLSITPIREALNKLAQEDLVVITPRTSYEVISLDKQDVKDILELRELLETFSLKTAGDNLSQFPVHWFRELFQKPYSAQNYKDFIEADAKFHSAIVAISANKKLWKLYAYINSLIRLLLVPAAKIEGRIGFAIKEHLVLLDAIEAQDLAFAMEQLTAHLESVKAALLHIYDETA